MNDLVNHRGFRACHPREEHFVPIYVAAGAGEEGEVRVLHGEFGIITTAFGVLA
jgi:aromatic ring-opening dioxygenase catalytic subunit (LigB family)